MPFGPVVLVSALACIAAEYLGLRWLVYLAKPVATLAIIAAAARVAEPVSPRYRTLVVAGLAWSLLGDVLLMLPQDLFVAGLAAFLVAHLCYISAFAGAGGGAKAWGAFIGVALFGAAMLAILWPKLGVMRLPVAAYVAVIATMAWQALARWRATGAPGAGAAALGGVLFLASDGAIAVGRFVTDFPGDRAFVLATYWAAQWLIASSVAAAASPVRPPAQ